MPRGRSRERRMAKGMPMESIRCLGIGSLTGEHTFLRPIGSHLRQCEACAEKSNRAYVLAEYHDERR